VHDFIFERLITDPFVFCRSFEVKDYKTQFWG
jgi:hypothetical protein